ncbi:MAG: response regulator [Candidatus Margulisiibacteriota bacterium]
MSEPRKKILVIEDELDLVEGLRLRLEANGYEVLVASDGADGLNQARNKCPDLVILDVRLPKLDGYNVCRMLKFDEKYQKIPIIMLTARVQQADVKLGKEAGADIYMTKPYKSEELLANIKKLLPGG